MSYEKKEYVLDDYLEDKLPSDATKEEEEAAKHEMHHYHSIKVSCLMFATILLISKRVVRILGRTA